MRMVICLLLVSMIITPAFALDWSMFKKDPSHSGFTTDEVNPPLVVKWTFDLRFDTDSSPVIVNDVLYIGSNGGIHAIDAKSGRELWRTPTNGFVKSVPAVVDGVLYIGADDNRFYAIDTKDGTIKWIYKNSTDGYISSAAVINNLAYEGSKSGSFYAFDVRIGEPLWETLTGKPIESSPAAGDGIIVFGTNGGVVIALDAANGKEKWRYDTGVSALKSSPAIADGLVVIGSNDGSIYALTAIRGTLKWKYSTGSNVESSPSIKDGTIFVGSKDSNLYSIDLNTGMLKWKFAASGFVESSPAISNDIVYFGSKNNFIYALDANTGRMLWRNLTGQKDKDYITSPAISGNMLYAATKGGVVYAYSGVLPPAIITPTAAPTMEVTPTVTETITPAASPTETKEAPGFGYSLLILLITILIRARKK
ncbi:MAG: PQQ-binding-like beta-propeller repeat protein [Euryarchaeota archaeon]|nr:PQQ-binding-like beta-propeller repeat protein [Euryarchaeota archaeon]